MMQHLGYRLVARFGSVENIEYLPSRGRAIVIYNHIGFIDPIVVMSALPRNVVPLARHDVFGEPGWGIFPRLWNVIPVRREAVDREALRKCLAVLEADEVILVSPEGTRHRELQRGKAGLAYLAVKSGAPVVPAAVGGTEGYPRLVLGRKDLPGAKVRLGRPFRFTTDETRPDRDLLRAMTDEAMYVLAAMLPEKRRGIYADLERATTNTLAFI